METDLISVVVPVYNAEKFIAKCIEHLIHQTYKNLEIILVNDGSTDNTLQICKKYAATDKRIKIITQKNSGPSIASNTGLENSNGILIHFHDHDDFVNLDFYEKMADAFALTRADVLCGEVNQPEYDFPKFSHLEICTSMKDKILKTAANKFNPAWRYVYKKIFLQEHNLRFDTEVFGCQDLFFTKTAIVLANSVCTVPNAIYNVVDTATALGKAKEFLEQKNANISPSLNRLYKLFDDCGATEYMNQPVAPLKIETFKMFNIPIVKKKIFTTKTRYYLFGINIGTKKIYKA